MVTKFLRLSFICFLLSGCSNLFSSHSSAPVEMPSGPVIPVSAPAATQVALLLPLNGDLANAGKAIQAGFNDAYQSSATKPIIKVYDTSQGNSITSLYKQAVSDGANYVVGPLDKNNVTTLLNHGDITVTTIALNNADSSNVVPNFYQFSLSPRAEAVQLADRATQDGYHNALMITPSGAWGNDIATALQNQWQKDGGTIVDSLSVNNDENLTKKIQNLLQVQGNSRRQDFDVIFLVARPMLAREIKPLLKYDYAGSIPVYGTSLVYTGLLDSASDQDLNGVKFCDEPLVLNPQGQWAAVRQQLTLSQPVPIQQYIRLYGLGWDAATLTQNFNAINQGVSGATGQLSLGAGQRIVRKVKWAKFQNGMPVPVPSN